MSNSAQNDADLVARVRAGDEHTFDVIYREHWLRLYRLACKITDDESAAQDIVQDAFVSFWEKGCHTTIVSIAAYLYQTVRFRCLMHLRSGNISRKHLAHFASLLNPVNNEDAVEGKEMEQLLEQSIAALPERCRQVFVLSRVQDLPNKKIAEELHISTKTVENQITKALRHLRLSIDKLAVLIFLTIN